MQNKIPAFPQQTLPWPCPPVTPAARWQVPPEGTPSLSRVTAHSSPATWPFLILFHLLHQQTPVRPSLRRYLWHIRVRVPTSAYICACVSLTESSYPEYIKSWLRSTGETQTTQKKNGQGTGVSGCARHTRTKAFNFTSHQRNASPAQHGAATHPQDDADQCRQRCGLCPRQKHTLVRPTATRPLLGTARVPTEAAARRCAGAGDGVRDLTPAGAAHEGTKGVSPSLRGTNQPVLRTAGRQGQPAGCRLGGPGTPERADACACTSVGAPRTSSCSAGTLHFQREPQTPPGQQARLSGIHRAGAEAATRPLEPTSRPRGPERGTCQPSLHTR